MSAKRRSPLSYAAKFGNPEVIKLLLETVIINTDAKDKTSLTPLHWAASKGYTVAVRMLLDLGKAKPDVLDSTNSTPLRAAMVNSDCSRQSSN
jgi:ankyrin repeat protein